MNKAELKEELRQKALSWYGMHYSCNNTLEQLCSSLSSWTLRSGLFDLVLKHGVLDGKLDEYKIERRTLNRRK